MKNYITLAKFKHKIKHMANDMLQILSFQLLMATILQHKVMVGHMHIVNSIIYSQQMTPF